MTKKKGVGEEEKEKPEDQMIWKLTREGEKDKEMFKKYAQFFFDSTDIIILIGHLRLGSCLIAQGSSHNQNILRKKSWRHGSVGKRTCHQTSCPEFNPGIHIVEGENQIR